MPELGQHLSMGAASMVRLRVRCGSVNIGFLRLRKNSQFIEPLKFNYRAEKYDFRTDPTAKLEIRESII